MYSSAGDIQIGNLDKTADEVAGALTAVSDEGRLVSISRELLLEQIAMSEQEESRKGKSPLVISLAADFSLVDTHLLFLLFHSGRNMSTLSAVKDGMNKSRDSVLVAGSTEVAVDGEKEIQLTTERRRTTARNRRTSMAQYLCTSLEGRLLWRIYFGGAEELSSILVRTIFMSRKTDHLQSP